MSYVGYGKQIREKEVMKHSGRNNLSTGGEVILGKQVRMSFTPSPANRGKR